MSSGAVRGRDRDLLITVSAPLRAVRLVVGGPLPPADAYDGGGRRLHSDATHRNDTLLMRFRTSLPAQEASLAG